MKGDLNGDGQIGLGDVILELQLVLNGGVTDPALLKVADVNCDGKVSLADAVLVLRAFVLGEALPCH